MEALVLIVTFASMLVAAGMFVVLWRATREDRQRAEGRVETLRELAFSDEALRMFTTESERGAGKRRGIAVAAVAATMLSIVGVAFALHEGPRDAAAAQSERPAAPKSLELLALRHTRGAHGEFVVTGEVRNTPQSGTLFDVAAGVELLDRQGDHVASLISPLPVGALHAGETSSFTVVFPSGGDVARYQVQFRLAGGSLVRHVDRRAALTGVPVERTRHAHVN